MTTILGWTAPAVVAMLIASMPAFAQFTVTDPTVERGELEIEWTGALFTEGALRHAHEFELSYGLTRYWAPGIGVTLESEKGSRSLRPSEIEWSNVLSLGNANGWEFGLEFNLAAPLLKGEAFEAEGGPAIAFTIGPVRTLVNAVFGGEFGRHSEGGVAFDYRWQSLWATSVNLDFGFEAYGTLPDLGDSPKLRDQEHRIGPVVNYLLPLADVGLGGEVTLAAGYLFGLTRATPDGTWNFTVSLGFDF